MFLWGGAGGVCAQDYCSAIIPRPSQRCSHEPEGLWVLLVPTEQKGHRTSFSLFLASTPPQLKCLSIISSRSSTT